jgi:DNA-binding LacI/PurR family transcriptional regulator
MGRKPKKINITKIAREAGVSESTVSRALNHRANVGEETRRKIDELMRKYNFSLTPARPREKKIALIVGSTQFSEYVSEVFTGIYEYAEQNELTTTVVFKHKNSKQTLLQQIRDQQCAGVIVILAADINGNLDELAESELPVILIDEAICRKGIGFIDNDSYSGSKTATEYLLELKHRKIGYIRWGIDSLNHIHRFRAYEHALKKANIEIRPDWVIQSPPSKNDDLYQTGFNQIQILLKQAPELTAVMASNDDLAIGAISGALAMGRKVPEDLSVVGFDNYKQTAFLNPPLTTVNHPIRDCGFLAAQHIDQYLRNPQNTELPREILPTELVIRKSTCPPSKKRSA